MKEKSVLRCPHCGVVALTYVTDSRPSGEEIRRRRICDNCGERATTKEVVVSRNLKNKPDVTGFETIEESRRPYWEGLVTYP